jgi:hypothetical protein
MDIARISNMETAFLNIDTNLHQKSLSDYDLGHKTGFFLRNP